MENEYETHVGSVQACVADGLGIGILMAARPVPEVVVQKLSANCWPPGLLAQYTDLGAHVCDTRKRTCVHVWRTHKVACANGPCLEAAAA